MQELFKLLSKQDLFLGRDKNARIYSKSYLFQGIKSLVQDNIIEKQAVNDAFKVENLQEVLEELEAMGEIFLFKDLIISKEFSQREAQRIQKLVKENGKVLVSSSEIPREFLSLWNDGKYYYSTEFLEREYLKLENKLLNATLPIDLALEYDASLLLLLKREFYHGDMRGVTASKISSEPKTKRGYFKGLIFVPHAYVLNVKQQIISRLKENGIIDITEYLSIIDVKEYLTHETCLIGNNLTSHQYLKDFSDYFLKELKKTGYKRLLKLGDILLTGQVLILLAENLKEDAIRILDDWFLLKEFLQVLKVDLVPVVREVVELKRLKKSKDEISRERGLEIIGLVTSKYIQEEELRLEVGELIYADFTENVKIEMQKTFKDSRHLETMELRKGLVMLEGFYRGIQEIQDSDLRKKLTRVLLDVKGKEYLRNCSVPEENSIKVRNFT